MKIRKFLAGFSLCITSCSFAQYGLIQDPDGYVNVRAQPSLAAEVIAKLKNNDVVYCHDVSVKAFCGASSSQLQGAGYIHQSRINFFKNFTRWKAEKTISGTAIYRFNQNQVSIAVCPAQFNIADFKSSKPNQQAHEFDLYKNKAFYGTDGEIPHQQGMYQLAEIKINFNGKHITIPQAQLEPYFFPNSPLGHNTQNDHEMATILSKDDQLYILLDLNTGGAGQYHLNVHIEQGKVKTLQAWRE